MGVWVSGLVARADSDSLSGCIQTLRSITFFETDPESVIKGEAQRGLVS